MNRKLFVFLLIGLLHYTFSEDSQKQEDEPVVGKSSPPLFTKFDPESTRFPKSNFLKVPITTRVLTDNSTINTNNNANSSNTSTEEEVICIRGINNDTTVQLVNDTELLKLLAIDPKTTKDKKTPALCLVAMFYSKNCRFSSTAAPHFNALPRAFPDIKIVAMNAMMHNLFNTQNGIVGVPMLLFFYNGKAIYRYNNTEYNLESFITFLSKSANISPKPNITVTAEDYLGPVISKPGQNTDIFLVISWIFIIICAFYYFSKSKLLKWIIETIQRDWRESEQHIQHEHAD